MAAANLVVKMLLDSGAFDTNIKSAQKQMQTFENVGKNVLGTLGKFAGGIGIATTAIGAFNQIMKASQTTSDFLDQQMRILTNSVDGFFTAIATGDFSYMTRGFEEIKRKAKEAQQAIDQLGNTTMSYDYFTSKNDALFQEALQKSKDKTLSQSDREAARATATAIIGEQEEISAVMADTLDETMRKVVTEKTAGLSWLQVGKEDIERILRVDVMKNRDDEKARLDKEYKEYLKAREDAKKWVEKNKKYGPDYKTTWGFNKLVEERMESQGITSEKYKDAILANEMLVKENDEWLANLIKIANQYDNVTRKIATMKQAMNEVNGMDMSKGITTSPKVTSSKEKVAPAVEGSLRWINEEIAKVQKELQNLNPELNPQKLQELQNKLADLENKKRKIEFEVTYIQKGEKQDSVALGKQGLLTDGWLALPTQKPKDTTENTNNTADTENKITANQKWAASINGVASALGAVTNMTNEGASAWISWGAGILTSIAAALPALETLFTAESAVGAATAARSAAETPVVGWILAGAAVASFLAAIAAIPKFANGGIVDSPFGVGDRVLARVNGGEMILNRHQQSNLFNLLNNGGTASTNKVTFEIEGKKLIGVLKNYNNKINKAL